MPRVNIFINQEKIKKFPDLFIDIEKLEKLLISIMIQELSCKEIQLKKDFFIIIPEKIVMPNTMKSLIDIKIEVVAYKQRVERQYEICQNIENYLQDHVEKILINCSNKDIFIKKRIFKTDLNFLSDMGFNQKPANKSVIIKARL